MSQPSKIYVFCCFALMLGAGLGICTINALFAWYSVFNRPDELYSEMSLEWRAFIFIVSLCLIAAYCLVCWDGHKEVFKQFKTESAPE